MGVVYLVVVLVWISYMFVVALLVVVVVCWLTMLRVVWGV